MPKPAQLTDEQRTKYEACASELRQLCELWTNDRTFVEAIPEHEHWNDNNNCNNLRNLVAAIIMKHFPPPV